MRRVKKVGRRKSPHIPKDEKGFDEPPKDTMIVRHGKWRIRLVLK